MTHVFWLGRDNECALELRDGLSVATQGNLSAERYDAITDVTLILRPLRGGGDLTLESAATPGLLTWSGEARTLTIEGSKLDDANVPAGSYRGRLIVFSADQPDGIVWIDFGEYAIDVRA